MIDMIMRRLVIDDGGRADAGYGEVTRGDCSVRAIAIAAGLPYQTVLDGINACDVLYYDVFYLRRPRQGLRSAQKGAAQQILQVYLGSLGWTWVPVGARMNRWDLPMGRLIVGVRKHLVAVIDHVIHDAYDSWSGRKRVDGYFVAGQR